MYAVDGEIYSCTIGSSTIVELICIYVYDYIIVFVNTTNNMAAKKKAVKKVAKKKVAKKAAKKKTAKRA